MTPKSLKMKLYEIALYDVHQMSLQQKAGAGGPLRIPPVSGILAQKIRESGICRFAAIPLAHCCTSCKHRILESSSIGIPPGMLFYCEVVLR